MINIEMIDNNTEINFNHWMRDIRNEQYRGAIARRNLDYTAAFKRERTDRFYNFLFKTIFFSTAIIVPAIIAFA